MYGIFAYIWLICTVSVGKYTVHDGMGTYTPFRIIWNPKTYEALENIYKFHSGCHVARFVAVSKLFWCWALRDVPPSWPYPYQKQGVYIWIFLPKSAGFSCEKITKILHTEGRFRFFIRPSWGTMMANNPLNKLLFLEVGGPWWPGRIHKEPGSTGPVLC